MSPDDLSQYSLLELFQQEAETQVAIITQGLLALERGATDAAQLEALMRAAHSLKGAARIVGLDEAVRVAHAMEDCFVEAQKGRIVLRSDATDLLLKSTDLFYCLAQASQGGTTPGRDFVKTIDEMIAAIGAVVSGESLPAMPNAPAQDATDTTKEESADGVSVPELSRDSSDRVLRVTAANLNRLLGLAGESLVTSRWLTPYAESLLRLKRQQNKLSKTVESLRDALGNQVLDEQSQTRLNEAQQQAVSCMQELSDRHAELEVFVRRSTNLSHRLYSEAVASRMRPFSDGIHGFPRLVRDLARTLGKEAQLEITGQSTQVDRDMLEKLESPLTHLLRNAVDHGLESPAERLSAEKPSQGIVRIDARHSAGLLVVTVEDDGRGISLDALRRAVVRKKLTTSELADELSQDELLDFLFLPGFSMREEVTEISGRGVGLDVVRNMVKSVGGSIRVTTEPGRSLRFQLQLPLTLSVMRVLLVEVAGEPYAFPLVRIHSTVRVPRNKIETLEGREHVPFGGERVGLIAASQILSKNAAPSVEELAIVILGDRTKRFGVAVDKFLGERELVVQPLDPRLGKVKDISAGALMPDGSPALIIDVDDFSRSIESLISGGRLSKLQSAEAAGATQRRKRVLVVDDSLTVRELERKLLGNSGYEVDVAVDGMDGWNAVRTQAYDLVVTDIDMPRMDGIELVRLIKKDQRLSALPVMIVSYKDRPEDRNRGLEAGADYYLTKGSFHDQTLLNAVADLIGDAEEATEDGE